MGKKRSAAYPSPGEIMNKQEIMELVDAYADSVFRGVWEGRAAIEAALPDVPTVPTVPEGFRKEAKRLASILASMGEGGYEIETLYTKDQADGDGFVRRAADLLVLLSAAPEPAQPTALRPYSGSVLAPEVFGTAKPAQAEQPRNEPVAYLHDDGYWTPAKTENGRQLSDRLLFAGSPKIAVYKSPQAQPMSNEQRRLLIDSAGARTEGLDQDDFAQEIVFEVERFHKIGG
jgi:hypothetical protein